MFVIHLGAGFYHFTVNVNSVCVLLFKSVLLHNGWTTAVSGILHVAVRLLVCIQMRRVFLLFSA